MSAHEPDRAFWRGKRVLLTGHTGFKGAWTALWLHQLGAEVTGLALPPDDLSLFRLLRLDADLHSWFVDLRDADGIARAVADARPELVLHLAAQALVRRALEDPVESFAVNVCGTVHLLNALRAVDGLRAVLVVTTDKVYADVTIPRAHREADVLGGGDPYAASKAACEIATMAMAESYLRPRGVAVATARAGNVIGGGDFAPWRLIPDIVRSARAHETPRLRDPAATRPWQHVLDCTSGYLTYLRTLAAGGMLPSSLNFGPSTRRLASVGDLAVAVQHALGAAPGWHWAPEPALHERHELTLNSRLARRNLDWHDRLTGRRMVAVTAAWYRAWNAGADMRAFTAEQINDYEALP